jgi:hypothetical protein
MGIRLQIHTRDEDADWLVVDEGTHLFDNSGYRFQTWRLQPAGTVGGSASMLVLSGWSFRNHHSSTPFGV